MMDKIKLALTLLSLPVNSTARVAFNETLAADIAADEELAKRRAIGMAEDDPRTTGEFIWGQ